MGSCVSCLFVPEKQQNLDLVNCNHKNTPTFSFKDMKTICKVVDVYDGDTVTVAFLYNDKYIKFSIRMLGYNSPEIAPKKKDKYGNIVPEELRQKEIHKAKLARTRMIKLVSDTKEDDDTLYKLDKKQIKTLFNTNKKLVVVLFSEFDKYGGRILGTIYDKDISINDIMLKEGYGYPYTGGTKEIFTE